MHDSPAPQGFHMADVRRKRVTPRRAVATGELLAGSVAFEALVQRQLLKGDATQMAEVAGIQGAKQAAQLMPLCHSINLEFVDVRCVPVPVRSAIRVYCEVGANARTGVEMEALAALGADVRSLLLPDGVTAMSESLRVLAGEGVRLAICTGGTGLAARDLAPEALADLMVRGEAHS